MTPLQSLRSAVLAVPGPDLEAAAAVAERVGHVLRPGGAFARLDEVAVWLGGWQRRHDPRVERPAAVIFGGDHGVAARAVSAYPADVTRLMVDAIERGVATSSALAAAAGVGLTFVDVGVGRPTEDFTTADAMTPERFEQAWNAGRRAVAELDADLLVIGELGIGNTTAAAAVAAGLFGGNAVDWVGRGTGVDDAGLERKRTTVQAGLDRLRSQGRPNEAIDSLEVLRCLGGTELVAMAGAAAEARRRSLPVVLDGFIATAAMATIERAVPGALDHAMAGHCSAEPGHRRLLDALGKRPLLDLDLRLGEATGALVAVPVVRCAAAAVSDVATFAEFAAEGVPGDR